MGPCSSKSALHFMAEGPENQGSPDTREDLITMPREGGGERASTALPPIKVYLEDGGSIDRNKSASFLAAATPKPAYWVPEEGGSSTTEELAPSTRKYGEELEAKEEELSTTKERELATRAEELSTTKEREFATRAEELSTTKERELATRAEELSTTKERDFETRAEELSTTRESESATTTTTNKGGELATEKEDLVAQTEAKAAADAADPDKLTSEELEHVLTELAGTKMPPVCQTHAGESLEFFCLSHDVPVCLVCSSSSGGEHGRCSRVVDIRRAVQQAKDHLESASDNVELHPRHDSASSGRGLGRQRGQYPRGECQDDLTACTMARSDEVVVVGTIEPNTRGSHSTWIMSNKDTTSPASSSAASMMTRPAGAAMMMMMTMEKADMKDYEMVASTEEFVQESDSPEISCSGASPGAPRPPRPPPRGKRPPGPKKVSATNAPKSTPTTTPTTTTTTNNNPNPPPPSHQQPTDDYSLASSDDVAIKMDLLRTVSSPAPASASPPVPVSPKKPSNAGLGSLSVSGTRASTRVGAGAGGARGGRRLSGSSLAKVLKVGDRVKRGCEWETETDDQMVGTVTAVPSRMASRGGDSTGLVDVRWDAGGEGSYRMGRHNHFELDLA